MWQRKLEDINLLMKLLEFYEKCLMEKGISAEQRTIYWKAISLTFKGRDSLPEKLISMIQKEVMEAPLLIGLEIIPSTYVLPKAMQDFIVSGLKKKDKSRISFLNFAFKLSSDLVDGNRDFVKSLLPLIRNVLTSSLLDFNEASESCLCVGFCLNIDSSKDFIEELKKSAFLNEKSALKVRDNFHNIYLSLLFKLLVESKISSSKSHVINILECIWKFAINSSIENYLFILKSIQTMGMNLQGFDNEFITCLMDCLKKIDFDASLKNRKKYWQLLEAVLSLNYKSAVTVTNLEMCFIFLHETKMSCGMEWLEIAKKCVLDDEDFKKSTLVDQFISYSRSGSGDMKILEKMATSILSVSSALWKSYCIEAMKLIENFSPSQTDLLILNCPPGEVINNPFKAKFDSKKKGKDEQWEVEIQMEMLKNPQKMSKEDQGIYRNQLQLEEEQRSTLRKRIFSIKFGLLLFEKYFTLKCSLSSLLLKSIEKMKGNQFFAEELEKSFLAASSCFSLKHPLMATCIGICSLRLQSYPVSQQWNEEPLPDMLSRIFEFIESHSISKENALLLYFLLFRPILHCKLNLEVDFPLLEKTGELLISSLMQENSWLSCDFVITLFQDLFELSEKTLQLKKSVQNCMELLCERDFTN